MLLETAIAPASSLECRMGNLFSRQSNVQNANQMAKLSGSN
jgi:hypothetical protein